MLQQHNNTKPGKNASTPIYSGDHLVGKVTGKVFNKSIHGSKHFLKRPPAIAISLDALQEAERAGALSIRVIDQDTGTIYRATIEHFREAGFELDRGFGLQIALTLEGWTRQRAGQLEQLPLWGG